MTRIVWPLVRNSRPLKPKNRHLQYSSIISLGTIFIWLSKSDWSLLFALFCVVWRLEDRTDILIEPLDWDIFYLSADENSIYLGLPSRLLPSKIMNFTIWVIPTWNLSGERVGKAAGLKMFVFFFFYTESWLFFFLGWIKRVVTWTKYRVRETLFWSRLGRAVQTYG